MAEGYTVAIQNIRIVTTTVPEGDGYRREVFTEANMNSRYGVLGFSVKTANNSMYQWTQDNIIAQIELSATGISVQNYAETISGRPMYIYLIEMPS